MIVPFSYISVFVIKNTLTLCFLGYTSTHDTEGADTKHTILFKIGIYVYIVKNKISTINLLQTKAYKASVDSLYTI